MNFWCSKTISEMEISLGRTNSILNTAEGNFRGTEMLVEKKEIKRVKEEGRQDRGRVKGEEEKRKEIRESQDNIKLSRRLIYV